MNLCLPQLPMLAQHPMDSYMKTWVPLCDSECVCPSHPGSGHPMHWYEFMSTLHPMSGPPPMDSYMESWVPGHFVCVPFTLVVVPHLV